MEIWYKKLLAVLSTKGRFLKQRYNQLKLWTNAKLRMHGGTQTLLFRKKLKRHTLVPPYAELQINQLTFELNYTILISRK